MKKNPAINPKVNPMKPKKAITMVEYLLKLRIKNLNSGVSQW